MKVNLKYLCLFIICLAFSITSWAGDCLNEKKARIILQEVRSYINTDICRKAVTQEHVRWLQQVALPQVMTKSFLGVEPPDNWPQLADQLLLGCSGTGNLCKKNVQEQFIQCVTMKMPFVLYQLAPWLDANCKKMNNAVIEHWSVRKPIIIHLITEYNNTF